VLHDMQVRHLGYTPGHIDHVRARLFGWLRLRLSIARAVLRARLRHVEDMVQAIVG
jgi:hypothetical protein